MNTGTRNLLVIAAVLIISVIASSVAFAQDATGTVEPSSTTAQATTQTSQPHGVLGVSLQNSASGVMVTRVMPGSGAANAGIEVGDVITAINGTTINTFADASKVASGLSAGAQVMIGLTRSGSTMTVTATLGQPNNPSGQPLGRLNFARRGFGFFNFHNRHGRGSFGRGRMFPFMQRFFNGRGRGSFGRGGKQPFFNGRGGRGMFGRGRMFNNGRGPGSFGRGRMFPFMQPFFNERGRGTFGRGFLNNRNAPRQNGQPLPEGRVI